MSCDKSIKMSMIIICLLNLRFIKQDQTLLWTCVAGACRCVNNQYAKFKYTGMKSDYIQISQCNLQ